MKNKTKDYKIPRPPGYKEAVVALKQAKKIIAKHEAEEKVKKLEKSIKNLTKKMERKNIKVSKKAKGVKALPCPLCKSKKVGVEILNCHENDRAVVCDDCKTTGPFARQHHLAIKLWNKEVQKMSKKSS